MASEDNLPNPNANPSQRFDDSPPIRSLLAAIILTGMVGFAFGKLDGSRSYITLAVTPPCESGWFEASKTIADLDDYSGTRYYVTRQQCGFQNTQFASIAGITVYFDEQLLALDWHRDNTPSRACQTLPESPFFGETSPTQRFVSYQIPNGPHSRDSVCLFIQETEQDQYQVILVTINETTRGLFDTFAEGPRR